DRPSNRSVLSGWRVVSSRPSSDLLLPDLHWNFRRSEQPGMVIPHSKMQDIIARSQVDGDFHRNTLLEDALVGLRFQIRVCLLHRGSRQLALTRVCLDLEV